MDFVANSNSSQETPSVVATREHGIIKEGLLSRAKKGDPAKGNAVAVKRDLNSAAEFKIKDQQKAKRKRLSTLKTEILKAGRPVLQRQHGIVENSCEKDHSFGRNLESSPCERGN